MDQIIIIYKLDKKKIRVISLFAQYKILCGNIFVYKHYFDQIYNTRSVYTQDRTWIVYDNRGKSLMYDLCV